MFPLPHLFRVKSLMNFSECKNKALDLAKAAVALRLSSQARAAREYFHLAAAINVRIETSIAHSGMRIN